jgi:heat shock protein HslJ
MAPGVGCTVRDAHRIEQEAGIMNRSRPTAMLVAVISAALLIWPASVATAQETPTGPEGPEWKLTNYVAGGLATAVPFGIAATLNLEGGLASGSGGCNTFSGAYALDGSTIMFDDQVSTTLKLCPADVQAVEDAYLGALPQVTSWAISDGVLELRDAAGVASLTFELPAAGLTRSELSALAATIAALRTEIATVRTEIATVRSEMTRLNVDRLRERVKLLEAGAEELAGQVADLSESNVTDNGGNGFSQAEGILLEGIPTRIASRCVPLRASLPKGTWAAVRCTPDTAAVATLDYYLMEGEDAANAFQDSMTTFNVPEAVSETQTCASGVKSQRVWIGNGWQSEGCWRANERAELRFVDNATECRQLKVGQKRIESPALYIALQGSSGDVEGVHAWATRNVTDASSQITSISQPIERPRERVSPSCPA